MEIGMLEAASEALNQMASWQVMLALMVGVAVGVLNGAMPGGAVPSLVVLLGFAYGQDPYIALPLAVGMVATVSHRDFRHLRSLFSNPGLSEC